MFSSIWSMTLLRISAWNAGHKPPSWKKAGRQSVLLGSLHPVLGAARLPAPTINAPPAPTEAALLALCLRFHFWELQSIRADEEVETAADDKRKLRNFHDMCYPKNTARRAG